MRAFPSWSRFVAFFVFAGLPIALAAQQLPAPGQAQEMMRNPATVNKVCQRVAASGMTPDQIRSRLRAAGYPDNLLDACLNSTGNDSTFKPNDDVYAAVRQLGVVDSTDAVLMGCGIDPDSLPADDSLTRDSSGQSIRSVRRMLADRCGALHIDSTAQKAQIDSGLVLFGLDFFRRPTNLFQPNLNGPVDSTYRLGPGDELVLILTGDVENSYTLDVTREGFIVIPQVGQIFVNNLTLSQLTDVLYTRLSRVYSGIRRGSDATTRFSVTPARLRSNLIYVTGNVLAPGAYQVSSAGTLLTALYAAGGPSDNGSLRTIEVRRAGHLVGTLDFYDYLIHGNSAGDIRLQNGDVVFVPTHLPRVRILGEINRPATYELKPDETLADVIGFAGGFSVTASRQRVQIQRILPPTQRSANADRILVDVTSDALARGDGPPFTLMPGDVIRVFPIANRVRNQIFVRGNVNTPGPEQLRPNMTVGDALRLAGGIKSDTYLGRVLILRREPDSTLIQLHVALRDTTGAVVNDIALQEDDEIHVFATSEFSTPRYVAIGGAVHHGGQYRYHEGMTLRDLVLLAGGLDQSAYLTSAKIARLPEDRTSTRTATEFNVPLDSSYLFERGPDGKYLGPPGLPASAGPGPDVSLKPYDNVLILRQPYWELQRSVALTGEVLFPGRYTLLSKNERITDVIKRAGGLTAEAYPGGVTFVRTQGNVGRIGVDLPEVLHNNGNRDNLLLQDGDSIHIPRFSALVMVQGAVNAPIAVSYVPGKDLNYYVRAAGGFSARADDDAAYVVQSNGKVETKSHRFLLPNYVPKPEPGSKVIVPSKDANEKPVDKVALASAVAGILSSFVAVALAISRF